MIIDDHVLIPHRANWNQRPRFSNIWRSELSASQTNKEERATLRDTPWRQMSYILTPWDDIERGYLWPMLAEATQTGYACVPWLGKAEQLAETATGSSFDFVAVDNFEAGQYLFFRAAEPRLFTSWEIGQIDTIVSNTVTLTDPLTDSYAAGILVWPLMFGKLTAPSQRMLNAWRGSWEITIEQQTP